MVRKNSGVPMKLIISFSGRENGNCDQIANYIATDEDKVLAFRDLNTHGCSNCNYECFDGVCKYRDDDVYGLYESMCGYEKIVLVVPMYCGNPSSLYFEFNERGQDFFMHHESMYENIISKLYVIGVYGSKETTPEFLSVFEKWFNGFQYTNRYWE